MSATTLNNTSTRDQARTQSRLTLWQALVGLLGIVTIVAFGVYLVTAINFRNRPFIGAMVSQTMVVNAGQPSGDVAWPGLARDNQPGLRLGDQIIALNGQNLFPTEARDDYKTAYATFNNILEALPRGQSRPPVDITFLRPGSSTAPFCEPQTTGFSLCTLSITPLLQLPNVDFLAFFITPFVAGVILVLLGVLIARYKWNTREGTIGIAIALTSALYTAGLFDVGSQGILSPIWAMGACMVSGSLIVLGISFPKRLKGIAQYRYAEHAVLAVFAALALYLAYQYMNIADPRATINTLTPFGTGIAAIGVLILWVCMHFQRVNATSATARDQANAIFIGTTLMLVPITLWLFSRSFSLPNGTPILPFNLELMVILNILPVAAIAYAVLQYRGVNTERVISEGITYGIMVGALVLSMFLLTFGASLLSIELFNATNNAVLISVILFAMVLVFTPVRNILQSRIDKIYYRQRRDLQAKVQSFNRSMTAMNDYDEIIKFFVKSLKETLAPSAIHIFLREHTEGDFVAYQINRSNTDIRFSANSPMIDVIQQADNLLVNIAPNEPLPHALRVEQPRLNLLKAQVIAGLAGRGTINGFVLLSAPTHQEDYTYEELAYLGDVVNQLAISTERSQVIQTLERRVQELDVLSQVGQAVNFTIELDDLLELIYNQTSKLIPTPNFYIALYEENINRLYFAFFLEGDDRHDEKEKQRWIVGQDLFSEVVKTNTAIRVNNFTSEMKKRGAELDLIGEGLLAWMGVPLTAGRQILGVMAGGKRRDTNAYSDDQFKIFSDVASLAATSLDKANLFNETRIRERQLTVLNDISRQLVATETDVEKLLQIIMTSAVEILNAEAGSLLLKTEDDTGDLEFRVVIGGGGDDLLGTRIAAGQGVVGRVVETNESIIVNDAASDPRHNVEVTEDFISHSLLAVPLTAKDEVIGVLEVINKQDGTLFVDGDANLLTTFASQAAVAIENARLFQLTDQQLAQRVKELETLERIDSELNRTQDLAEVARITVSSAMNVLGATAGALGIVHQSPPFLEIVSIFGYKREEYPEDATGDDGLIWPLDAGIVKRVMRSRQADITMDVSIDPDYSYGQNDSNSQITLPMLSGDEVNAILILEKNTLPRFSLPDWAFAQRIAEHASIAIANAQFYLALSNAMKSKSEFMGFAAHELKQPLASIKGYADVMRMTGELSDQQDSFLNTIKSNANRMQVLIDDLRDSAKIDANEFKVDAEPMNIRTAVVETLRPFVNQLAEKNQELVNNVPEDLPLIWGDETRIIQVLTNLVSNAHKYSHNDTTITVSGELRENYVDRGGFKRGRMVVISVSDQGIGMSEDDQKRLFKERYFRSTNNEARDMAAGTGLGMTLTYNIMLQHKGEIWIESELGKGSTFLISFPLAEDMQAEIEQREKLAGD